MHAKRLDDFAPACRLARCEGCELLWCGGANFEANRLNLVDERLGGNDANELAIEPDHWFLALGEITGEDPVKPTHDFDSAVNAWLEWGKTKGII